MTHGGTIAHGITVFLVLVSGTTWMTAFAQMSLSGSSLKALLVPVSTLLPGHWRSLYPIVHIGFFCLEQLKKKFKKFALKSCSFIHGKRLIWRIWRVKWRRESTPLKKQRPEQRACSQGLRQAWTVLRGSRLLPSWNPQKKVKEASLPRPLERAPNGKWKAQRKPRATAL